MQTRLLPRFFAGAALLAIPAAGMAADAVRASAYPPPGLYRVDTEGSLQRNRGDLPAILQQSRQDGATGSAELTSSRAGEASTTQNAPGQGPVTYCMPALPAAGTMPVAKGCRASAPVSSPGSVNYISLCGGVKMNTTIRKIDDKTWEYKVVSTESGGPMTGQQNFAGTRAVLAAQEKNGATAEERAHAAGLLAQMGTYEAEMKSKAAELAQARAQMASGGGGVTAAAAAGGQTKERTSVHRLTRIGATCSAPAAP